MMIHCLFVRAGGRAGVRAGVRACVYVCVYHVADIIIYNEFNVALLYVMLPYTRQSMNIPYTVSHGYNQQLETF